MRVSFRAPFAHGNRLIFDGKYMSVASFSSMVAKPVKDVHNACEVVADALVPSLHDMPSGYAKHAPFVNLVDHGEAVLKALGWNDDAIIKAGLDQVRQPKALSSGKRASFEEEEEEDEKPIRRPAAAASAKRPNDADNLRADFAQLKRHLCEGQAEFLANAMALVGTQAALMATTTDEFYAECKRRADAQVEQDRVAAVAKLERDMAELRAKMEVDLAAERAKLEAAFELEKPKLRAKLEADYKRNVIPTLAASVTSAFGKLPEAQQREATAALFQRLDKIAPGK